MKDLRLKLWSLLIACATAFFVNSQTNAGVVTVVVPVELQNLPKEKLVIYPTSGQAQVKLRGPSYLLATVGTSPPRFRVRVPEDSGNQFTIGLQESSLDLPPGLNVQGIEPPEIEFILDDVVKRDIKVELARIGELASFLRLKSITVDPPTVTVEGPSTEFDLLKILETTPLDMRELKESTTRELELRKPGKFLKPSVQKVKVAIEVISRQVERTFTEVPIEIRSTEARSLVAKPSKATVEVSGPKKVVTNMKKGRIVPYVRVENGTPVGTQKHNVLVDMPEGVSLVFVNPAGVLLEEVATIASASPTPKKESEQANE